MEQSVSESPIPCLSNLSNLIFNIKDNKIERPFQSLTIVVYELRAQNLKVIAPMPEQV